MLRPSCFDEPDLADAALHLVGRGMLGLRHRIERAAEFDDVPVAVVPIVQQRKIIPDFVDRHRVPLDPANPYIGSPAIESEYHPIENEAGFRALVCGYGGAVGRCHSATRSSGVSVSRGDRAGAVRILDAADRAGMVGRALVGDDLIELARALLGAVSDHGRGLAADFAGLPAGACRTGSCRTPPRSQPTRLPTRSAAAASPIQVSSPWATARAPARARMPCEAEKTSRDPGRRLGSVAVDPAINV